MLVFLNPIQESMQGNRQAKTELRSATYTLTAMVFTYLVCNSFSVFVTIMENIFPGNWLMFNEDGSRYLRYFLFSVKPLFCSSTAFYTITADLVSILVALNSMLRIFVYALCNPQFRVLLIGVIHSPSVIRFHRQLHSFVSSQDNNNDCELGKLARNRSTLSLPATNGDATKIFATRQRSAEPKLGLPDLG
jgi:hypothetical protein